MSTNLDEETKEILASLGADCDPTHPRCLSEYQEIKRASSSSYMKASRPTRKCSLKADSTKVQSISWNAFINHPTAGVVSIKVQPSTRVSGWYCFPAVTTTTYYLTSVMLQARMTHWVDTLITGSDSIMCVLGAMIPVYYFVERAGPSQD